MFGNATSRELLLLRMVDISFYNSEKFPREITAGSAGEEKHVL